MSEDLILKNLWGQAPQTSPKLNSQARVHAHSYVSCLTLSVLGTMNSLGGLDW